MGRIELFLAACLGFCIGIAAAVPITAIAFKVFS
jgi:4-hydroxy-3-methylbut-2-enyl diphosphate reductase IspH